MAEERVQRRLAAILAADVVGYSRLMGVDEAGTLARLKALRKDVIDPRIAEHGGRIVKLMGDGTLVEFPSVVDAVRCAAEIQRAMMARSAEMPEDQRIEFRMGINLSDVIVDGEDIYGDGVNVAARLEGLAEPGGLCVSDVVHGQVEGKLDLGFDDLGKQRIKNIAKPVRVYRARLDAGDAAGSKPLALPDKPSIAVLPFTNMSGDPEQEYFADGITEDLITALSKIRWFFVIARSSTFTYKGQAVEVTQVARELGVRYVIEGSVRKAGNSVRITAQLIDATTGQHIWAEHYDRDLADIFELQDEMTQTIVGAVEPELGAVERERAARRAPESLDAWETYQRGLWHMWQFTKADVAEARRLLRRAREIDPGFAIAYANEAFTHFLDVMVGHGESPDDSIAAGLTAAKKAVALDDKDSVGYFALGRIYLLRGEQDASIAELETALLLNPSFAQAHHGLGFAQVLSGRLEEGAEALDMALRLSPRGPMTWGTTVVRSLTCTLLHQYEEAAEWARETMRNPRVSGYWPHAALASALGNLGRIEEARDAVQEALRLKPDLSIGYLAKTLPAKHPNGLDPYLDGLRKAGLPE